MIINTQVKKKHINIRLMKAFIQNLMIKSLRYSTRQNVLNWNTNEISLLLPARRISTNLVYNLLCHYFSHY